MCVCVCVCVRERERELQMLNIFDQSAPAVNYKNLLARQNFISRVLPFIVNIRVLTEYEHLFHIVCKFVKAERLWRVCL